MPMWCPPTPPQQDTDVYVDHSISFLYNPALMSETQLPPVYIKKEKRSRLEVGLIDSRRALKIPRKEDSMTPPKSLFYSPHILKLRREKYRGIMSRPMSSLGKPAVSKPASENPMYQEWTIHEDMAILKAIQALQGLPLNLLVISPGHTPNWDFVADYVNTVSVTHRSPKQCRIRYESTLMQREEGKHVLDNSLRKKKKSSSGGLQKFSFHPKSSRPLRTSQLYTQDNNTTFSQNFLQRQELIRSNFIKKTTTTTKPAANNASLKNPKHTPVMSEFGIDIDHPVLPVDMAARRHERLIREKKTVTSEQHLTAARLHMLKLSNSQSQTSSSGNVVQGSISGSSGQVIATTGSQGIATQASPSPVTTTVTTTIATASNASSGTIRTSRLIGSPIQTSTVVSVAGLSPAHLQNATQRLLVSTPGQAKTVVGTAGGLQGKTISQTQLQMIRQATMKQQLRLQPGTGTIQQGVKTSTVAIGGQQAVVQFSQAQSRPQFVRQGTVTVGKSGIARTVPDEVAQLIKKQQHIQQQKALAAGNSQSAAIQSISPQMLAIQPGTSGTQVATLVKAVSSTGVTQTVSIPVTGVTLATPSGKTITQTIKTTNPQQLRHLQLQQQLLAQKKLGGQKISLTQVGGKSNIPTQLIVGSKPLTPAVVQQFQQVMRSPMGVSQTPVVLAKGPSRVIPVNTGQGTKQTIQVVAASSQALTSLRPQGSSSALAGALSGLKVPVSSSHVQQALLSQVSVALHNQNMRQGSPVRIQTSSGAPVVAVSVQSPTVAQQQGSSSSVNNSEQVSRFIKK